LVEVHSEADRVPQIIRTGVLHCSGKPNGVWPQVSYRKCAVLRVKQDVGKSYLERGVEDLQKEAGPVEWGPIGYTEKEFPDPGFAVQPDDLVKKARLSFCRAPRFARRVSDARTARSGVQYDIVLPVVLLPYCEMQ
jgi:hypothetical protein